jgi:CheY-like chemotaxis protein
MICSTTFVMSSADAFAGLFGHSRMCITTADREKTHDTSRSTSIRLLHSEQVRVRGGGKTSSPPVSIANHLPAQPSHAKLNSNTLRRPMFPTFRKKRVFLLDDDAAMQRLVTTLLRREGYRVDSVNSGDRAIETLTKTKFDAILLDLMMPYAGGMTVIRHLRENNPDLLKRVIVLTATSLSIIKSVESDIFAVVRKPFEPPQLIETVRRLTG